VTDEYVTLAGMYNDNDSVASEVSIASLNNNNDSVASEVSIASLDNNDPEVIISKANRLLPPIEQLLDTANTLVDILKQPREQSRLMDDNDEAREQSRQSMDYILSTALLNTVKTSMEALLKVKEETSKLDSLLLGEDPECTNLLGSFKNKLDLINLRLDALQLDINSISAPNPPVSATLNSRKL
jgi:hypothetical protein